MNSLSGKRIFVVEDEALIAMLLEDMLTDMSATVVGPAMTIDLAVDIARTEAIDAAVLDVNVRGEPIDPVASILRERLIPIVFATGYGDSAPNATRIGSVVEKPYTQEKISLALDAALSAR